MDLNLRALDAAVVVEITISYTNKAEFSCVARIVSLQKIQCYIKRRPKPGNETYVC